MVRPTFRPIAIATALCVGLASAIGLSGPATQASSHREAPLIAFDPQADNTDLYAFVSPDAPNTVTIVANYIPFQNPDGAPNYHRFDEDVRYEINIDNVGDAKSHITYRFEFDTQVKNQATFLYATGPVTSLSSANLNVTQTYTLTEIVTPLVGSPTTTILGSGLVVPPANIGEKSTPNYTPLGNAGVQTVANGAIKVFAGPRDDPFWVDLGSIFDLLTLRPQAPPIGYAGGPTVGIDSVSGFNVHSIVLQLPTSRITRTNEPVIGVWATANRPKMRTLSDPASVLLGASDGLNVEDNTAGYVQVSRLGMPLVNEVVLPIALKDAFNGLTPDLDAPIFTASPSSPAPFNDPNIIAAGAVLKESVLDPELQKLLNALYGVPNPGDNRSDIFEIFLTGIDLAVPFDITLADGTTATLPSGTVVNKHTEGTDGNGAGIVPAEMLRLNTALRPGTECSAIPNYDLGLLGGDACGFPNGRRLQDDVTRISLLAVAGAAWTVTTGDTNFTFNTALIPVLTDGTTENDKPMLSSFPYVPEPNQGQEWDHKSLVRRYFGLIVQNSPTTTASRNGAFGPR